MKTSNAPIARRSMKISGRLSFAKTSSLDGGAKRARKRWVSLAC
jgi:hypothetical protein